MAGKRRASGDRGVWMRGQGGREAAGASGPERVRQDTTAHGNGGKGVGAGQGVGGDGYCIRGMKVECAQLEEGGRLQYWRRRRSEVTFQDCTTSSTWCCGFECGWWLRKVLVKGTARRAVGIEVGAARDAVETGVAQRPGTAKLHSVASVEPSRTRASRPRWAGTSSKDVQRRATCQGDRTEVNEHKSVCQEQSDLAVISWYSASLKGVRCYDIECLDQGPWCS